MHEIHQIVVPVDFSKNSSKLVDYACFMAEKLSAKIHFIHVAETFQGQDMLLGSSYFGGLKEKIVAAAQERMENLIEDTAERCKDCTGSVVTGDVVDSIVEEGEKQKADLVIISTHGAKGLEKILLGSVAERVIKKASCPTLMYNPLR